jgi:hypothetical protein
MAGPGSLLSGKPSKEDYDRADEFIRWANARDGVPPERQSLLLEFRHEIARTYQAERQMNERHP